MKLFFVSAAFMIVTAATGAAANCCLGHPNCPENRPVDVGSMTNNNGDTGKLCCKDWNIDPDSSTIQYCDSHEEMPKLRGAAITADKFNEDAFVEAVATKIADAAMKKISAE